MSTTEDVLHLVEARARALAEQDAEGLRLLMHPECVWTSYAGLVLDRDEYVHRNTTAVTFASQRFEDPVVRVVGDKAVVTGTVVDTLRDGEQFRLLITMTWVRCDGLWQLLAGHAGPRLAS
ncbi:nuclear transport factor 2 family protein [Luteococcus peritonei]|uniref:Nuclear transport factor 2 family protein n=1 Tax=Luteococcus peritonei TaxID=88874 RepID=A0ABW4S074_9ACTN